MAEASPASLCLPFKKQTNKQTRKVRHKVLEQTIQQRSHTTYWLVKFRTAVSELLVNYKHIEISVFLLIPVN